MNIIITTTYCISVRNIGVHGGLKQSELSRRSTSVHWLCVGKTLIKKIKE